QEAYVWAHFQENGPPAACDQADAPDLSRPLPVRRQRPRDRRAAEHPDELPPHHQMIKPHLPPPDRDRMASYSKWQGPVRGSTSFAAVHESGSDPGCVKTHTSTVES